MAEYYEPILGSRVVGDRGRAFLRNRGECERCGVDFPRRWNLKAGQTHCVDCVPYV